MTKKGNVFVILNAVKNPYGPCSEKGQLLAQRYFPTKPETYWLLLPQIFKEYNYAQSPQEILCRAKNRSSE
jgi:hypothetical protein